MKSKRMANVAVVSKVTRTFQEHRIKLGRSMSRITRMMFIFTTWLVPPTRELPKLFCASRDIERQVHPMKWIYLTSNMPHAHHGCFPKARRTR